jgi:putative hydrolase of the HAD superfamily
MPSAILFDAVGTLIHPDPPVAAAYSALGRRFGAEFNETELLIRFRAAFARQEAIDRQQYGYKSSPQREQDRWREIVGDVYADAALTRQCRDDLFHALWDHFARPESWRIDEDVLACWEALESQGLKIAIASNFDGRLEQIVEHLCPLNRAARLYISARIGYRKPSTEFFRAIERDLGLRPAELLSVGDDLDNDYRGAEAAGWSAILIDRGGACRSPGVRSVLSLRELAEHTR